MIKTKCVEKLTSLRKRMKNVENKSKEIKENWKRNVENKAVHEIKKPICFLLLCKIQIYH